MADSSIIAATLMSDLKRDFGLSNEQAAGVVGNLLHESAGFQSLQEISPVVPGSRGGFGYAQWTGDRRKAFERYAKTNDLDPSSYEANYGFLKHEVLSDPYERKQFMSVKKADTAAEAARLISENYLRPGIPHNASRVRLAEAALGYADMPIPPGSIPEVGTALDTERPGTRRSFRYADQDTGNLKLLEPTPAPAIRAGLTSFLNRPDDFVPARLPDLPPSTLDRRAVPQSIIERAPAARPAPRGLLEALGSGSASARLAQGETPAARGLLAGLAGNAGDSLARAPVMGDGASPLFNGAYSPSMDAITQIAPMASYGMNVVTPQRAVPQSIIERSAPRVTAAPMVAAAPRTVPKSIIERSPAPSSYSNAIRSIASMETTQRQPATMDPPGSKTSWGDFNQAMAAPKQPAPISVGNVMASQAPRIDSIGSGSAWSDFTGTMAPRSIVAQPTAPAKSQDRLASISALSINPIAPAQVLPTKPQLEAATGFRTISKPTQIENPAYTKWKADNLSVARKPVPLGDVLHTGSRDSVAQAAAGANFVATKMPDRWLTVQKQVRVPVVTQPAPVVRQAPLAIVPRIAPAPVPVSPFAPNTAQNPIMGLLGAITGQRGQGDLLSSILGAASARPPVGAVLGVAANGGQMIQGYNGVKNSITQESDAWKKATGQSSYGSGQSNDTRYESYF